MKQNSKILFILDGNIDRSPSDFCGTIFNMNTMNTVIKIRESCQSDVKSIVSIHQDAFKDFFLTSLGTDFLTFYYSRFLTCPDAKILCALEEDRVVGFAALAENCKGFNGRLVKRNLLSFAFLSVKMLFTSPKALLRLVNNLTKKSSEVNDVADYAELFSIGVLATEQGKGIGKFLLASSEDYVRTKKIAKMSLTTDYYNNDKTISFYKAMGYHELYEFIAYPNRKMYRFIKEL